jgi:hypothetical protein
VETRPREPEGVFERQTEGRTVTLSPRGVKVEAPAGRATRIPNKSELSREKPISRHRRNQRRWKTRQGRYKNVDAPPFIESVKGMGPAKDPHS